VSSVRERQQRAAARARLEREMSERLAVAQRRRRRQTVAGAGVAVLVVLAGGVGLVTATTGKPAKKSPAAAASATPSANAAPAACAWTPVPNAAQNKNLKNVGAPPTSGEPRSGSSVMTITTNVGVIKVDIDRQHAPCTTASFAYLAGKKFFDNTSCHRMTTSGIYVLQCGDPSGTGQGGPTYQFGTENLPTGKRPAYPAGTVAMARTQDPNTNGSQFFIVYKDSELPADYTVFGTVTQGLDVVQKVAAAGVVPADPSNPGDGKPKQKVTITSLTVGPVTGGATASPSPSTATS
jgi:peptidyl-prolyl cis-trans isomerase B (cyclophilin B)